MWGKFVPKEYFDEKSTNYACLLCVFIHLYEKAMHAENKFLPPSETEKSGGYYPSSCGDKMGGQGRFPFLTFLEYTDRWHDEGEWVEC